MNTHYEKRIFRGFAVSFFILLAFLSAAPLSAQDTTSKAGPWRVEIEPTAYIGKGYSVLASHTIGKKRALSLGLYTFSVNLPDRINERIFENVTDSFDIRITFELAATARYKFALAGRESGPYIGMFIGWESFRLKHPLKKDLNTSNMFCTPQFGYEFYFYKKMLYINPSVRTVFEFARDTDDDARLEKIRDFILLPSLSVGIRF